MNYGAGLMGNEKSFDAAVRLHAALQLPGIGARTVQKAIDSGSDIFDSSTFISALVNASTRVAEGSICAEDFEGLVGACWSTIEFAVNDGQRIITYLDDEFPCRLRNLTDPPLIIFCKGNLSLLNDELPAIAVVGSRKAGDFGLRVAKRFGEVLAEKSTTVISGLAIGCDAYAHEGCLEKDGGTIAVLPSPLNKIVPEQNAWLADRIISKCGLLISEQPPLSKIDRSSFVRRNRIQAALSDKVIIIETAVDGGTMRTAEFAQKLKRPIAAYDFPEKHRGAGNEGNVKLINEGIAVPLYEAESILSFLSSNGCGEEAQLSLLF